MSSESVTERVCRLGGETRNRGFVGAASTMRLIAFSILLVIGLVLLTLTKSPWVLAGEVVAALVVWWTLSRRTDTGDAWTGTLSDELRWRWARRRGGDRFDPDGYATRALPLEVGPVRFMAVSPFEGGPELALVRHDLDYVTTVIEVIGGGEGIREIAQTNTFGARFGQFLSRLARPDLPVDQVDVATRVLPVHAAEYEEWIAARLRPDLSPELRTSMTDLTQQAAWSGEAYRTLITVRMPYDGLVAKTARRGVEIGPESIAETAFEVTGEVSRAAARAGLKVRAGLGPKRLGALIRHLYVPSVPMDDLTGLEGARDGFVPYDAGCPRHRLGFEAFGPDGSTWWHATATIPRDGLPMGDVGVRWLECLVTDVNPPVIRTVSSQFRLIPKHEARTRAAVALTADRAAIIKDENRGVVSTGEKEAQASVPQQVLVDLLHADAAGCEPALRVTVSAPTYQGLLTARETIDTAAQDGGVTKVSWHDTRHHQAHALTLPFAKGIAR